MIKKIKTKRKKIILTILLLVFTYTSIVGLLNIGIWITNNKNTSKQIDKVQDTAKIVEIKDNDNTEVIESIVKDKANPYWDYIKMNLIDVDFNELKKTNNQTKGWIQVNGTTINYPFVQTTNNEYYLTHSFDKSQNYAGWIFLDYRNKLDSSDKNIIIYAHGRLDKTMFGSLKNILNNEWLNNVNNYVVKLSTGYENTLWQVFSIYQIPTTSDYLQTEFNSDENFNTFAKKLINRSTYDFNVEVGGKDRILTLSTCYNDYDKIVLHAKLIKREVR